MKEIKRNIYYFSIFLLFFTAITIAPAVLAQNTTATITVEMKTKNGTVKIYLPSDIRAGDTISGSVVDERKNTRSSDTLEGAVIDINGQQHKLRDKMFTFVVPSSGSVSPFILKNSAGREIGRSNFSPPIGSILTSSSNIAPPIGFVITTSNNVRKTGAITAADFNFTPPRLGQTGRDISIPGNFDGSAETTNVNIGGKSVPIIAESPRTAIVQIPADAPAGQTNITIRENGIFKGEVVGVETSYKFNVVSLQLSADKLNLQRGETTTLHAVVNGLEGLADENGRVLINFQNQSSSVVRFSSTSSDSITTELKPDNNGVATINQNLTGVGAGGFTIYATVWSDYLDSLAAEAANMTLPDLDAKLSDFAKQLEAEGRDNGTDTAKYRELEAKYKVYLKERRARSKKSP